MTSVETNNFAVAATLELSLVQPQSVVVGGNLRKDLEEMFRLKDDDLKI